MVELRKIGNMPLMCSERYYKWTERINIIELKKENMTKMFQLSYNQHIHSSQNGYNMKSEKLIKIARFN